MQEIKSFPAPIVNLFQEKKRSTQVLIVYANPLCMIADTQDDIYPPEYLNSVRISGLPKHKSKLKVRVPVMLLRNIDQQSGLCNGTRLRVCQLGNHVIEAKILSGNNMGQKVSIPRILMCPSDVRQLYVAIPRVTHKAGFKILICYHKGHTRNTTTNVVYKEVFRNI